MEHPDPPAAVGPDSGSDVGVVPEGDPWPDVDIVVVAHNGGDKLRAAVHSLLDSRNVTAHVIVVDNASTDGSLAQIDRLPVRLVRLAANVGYGSGFNAGLTSGSSPWVVCSNQDVVVRPDTLSLLLDAARGAEKGNDGLVFASPRIVRTDGSTAETGHRIPSFADEVSELVLGTSRARNILPFDDTDPRPARCDWVSAVLVLGRRSSFNEIGGFDPGYFMYVEDLDFFRRFHDRGGSCIWQPLAIVVHSGGINPTSGQAISGHLYALTLWNIRRYFDVHARSRLKWQGPAVLAAGSLGSALRAVLWSGRVAGSILPLKRCRDASSADAVGMARMFAAGALWSSVALVTGRLPHRIRRLTEPPAARTNPLVAP